MSRTTDPDVRLFAALADPVRLAIVRQLAECDGICTCDFGETADVSQPTISHHLKVLREAGVIESERRGSWIYYRLAPGIAGRLQAFAASLAGGPQLIPASSLLRSPAPARAADAQAPGPVS